MSKIIEIDNCWVCPNKVVEPDPNPDDWFCDGDEKCRTCPGNAFNRKPKYDTELLKMVVSNFEFIVELSEKLNTGNVSHNGKVILGIAKRNIEYLNKKINS